MKKMIKLSVAAAIMMGSGAVSAQAMDVLTNVYAKGEIRARYEMVDQDTAGLKNANAFTNRLVIGAGADLFGTDWLSGYAEMTDVHNINDNYNSGSNGQTGHAVVADPEQTRVTQAYVDAKVAGANIRMGRQALNLDNQRFIGSVGWRQMPQTFDAVTVTYNAIKDLKLFASYVTKRNGINTSAALNYGTRDLLLNASYQVMPELKATAYAYLISGNTTAAGSDTYGISLTGNVAVSDALKLNYRAEYADQSDASMENGGQNSSTSNVEADYYNLSLGANYEGFLVNVGYEAMGGAEGTAANGFVTPYSTLHAHSGWADVFLLNNGQGVGNNAGLEDLNFMLGYKAKGFGTFKIIYHDFQSETGSVDFGEEIDAVYVNKVPGVKGLTGMLKVASYDADNNNGASQINTDVTKFWAMLDYKFSTK